MAKINFKGILSRAAAFAAAAALSASVFSFSAAADRSGVCTASALNVRSGAGTENARVGMIYEDESVTVLATVYDSNGSAWYKIQYYNASGTLVTGYASAAYIELGEEIADNSGSDSGSSENVSDSDFEAQMKKQGFPESYKPFLRQLHEEHPKWVFTAQKTGLDWNDVLREECVVGRNLVHGSALSSWKSCEKGAYDVNSGTWYGLDGTWVAASKEIIAYYLDPRNFITEDYIFMFENQSYNADIHKIEGVRAILDGTFMSGDFTAPDTWQTYNYAQTFMDAAAESGVSPYHLASRCRNEQGVYGAPQSLGTVPGYENYFNFFDIQAYYTADMTAGQMGCRFAKTYNPTYLLPWTNQYKSIVGGAIYLGNGYINKKQDTLYLQKFDVLDGGNGLYYHQYMTCVFGQANEAREMRNAYSDEVIASALEFKIPVYENMPEKLCPKPTSYGDNNNLLKSLTVTGGSYSPDFDRYTNEYSMTVEESVSSVTIAAVPYSYQAKLDGTGKINLDYGENIISVNVTAASGVVRTYTIKITRKGSGGLLKGDVNGDGSIDVRDALSVLNFAAGKTTLKASEKKRADVDGSGSVDVLDAVKIMQYASGKISKF
ncbi:MAG: cadherin-like beta sandwich domain-containing protein [Oscillospiraceae bacterium]